MSGDDMRHWRTGIARVVSDETTEEVVVRGERLSDLVGNVSFAEMMFLLLSGRRPDPAQARVLDALLVASMEHGIAPPSMIARCFASYGTTIQAAMAGGILSFGDVMGGAGEQFAKLLADAMPADDTDDGLDAAARTVVAEARAAGDRVPGFGIPLHGADPRAPKLLEIAEAEGVSGRYCRLAQLVEREIESAAGRAIPMNLDGVIAAVILDLGFPWQAARAFLITPRSVSLAAHYLEEHAQGTRWRHLPTDDIDYTSD